MDRNPDGIFYFMEIWKDIEGYKGYQVSSIGRIRSLKFNKEKILSQHIATNGYYMVGFYGEKYKTFTIHSLVAVAFLGHKPNGYKTVVDHIDNNKLNNNVENLQLISNRENISRQKPKTSKYTGVSWCKTKKKWKAQITINRKTFQLGRYKCELKAHLVYKEKLNSLL
jgi:hypothetical protein